MSQVPKWSSFIHSPVREGKRDQSICLWSNLGRCKFKGFWSLCKTWWFLTSVIYQTLSRTFHTFFWVWYVWPKRWPSSHWIWSLASEKRALWQPSCPSLDNSWLTLERVPYWQTSLFILFLVCEGVQAECISSDCNQGKCPFWLGFLGPMSPFGLHLLPPNQRSLLIHLFCVTSKQILCYLIIICKFVPK